MTCHHLEIFTLIFVCFLLVCSWSDNIGGDEDEEGNVDNLNAFTKKAATGKIIKTRNKNGGKFKMKFNKNKHANKKKNKKNKKIKGKGKNKGKRPTKILHEVNCGFDDNQLIPNKTSRSPFDTAEIFKWDNGKIPYYFDGRVTEKDKAIFTRAMDKIEGKTCFRFTNIGQQPVNVHHLQITVASTSCFNYTKNVMSFSAVVRTWDTEKYRMNLHSYRQLRDNSRCRESFMVGGILHELWHVLGVGHTQKRKDRDEHVNIHWGNIIGKKHDQYEMCTDCRVYPTIPYDCKSIVHYGFNTMRKDHHGPTMTAVNPNCCPLTSGGYEEPTTSDWDLLNILGAKVCKTSCTGTVFDWSCCTSSNPCPELQGDCDSNSDCAGSLICGTDNCKDFYDGAHYLADCCVKPEALSFCANDWDGYLKYECISGRRINRIASYHDNHREDRRWHFDCSPYPASFIPSSCGWVGGYTHYDEIIDFQCPGSVGVLVGLKSYHDNHREDRKWQFKCCSSSCGWTDWINWWDGWMDYIVPSHYHIAGLHSVHDNGREDRRWKLFLCKNDANSRSSSIDDAEIPNSSTSISEEDLAKINALFPSRCPQTEACLKTGGTCQKENEMEEIEKNKETGREKGKPKGKGKRKRKRKQQEQGKNLCKLGCKCMRTI